MVQQDGKDERLDRARNLFEFLKRAQELNATTVHRVDSYESVVWLADLPQHEAIKVVSTAADVDPDAPFLSVDRVQREDPPEPPAELTAWLTGSWSDAESEPGIREWLPAATVPDLEPRQRGDDDVLRVYFEGHPDLRAAYAEWRELWDLWAEIELERRPVREVYNELFAMQVKLSTHPEELELVVGIGALAWNPQDHERVLRHLITVPATVVLDDSTGRLTIGRNEAVVPFEVELDMLDPRLLKNPQHINDLKVQAKEQYESHPLNRDDIGDVVRRLVHSLDAEAEYRDEVQQPVARSGLVASFAPALVLRKRSQRGMVEIFDTITRQLAEAEDVPSGILPLVDPDHRVQTEPDTTPGGLIPVGDDELFLPLPVNERQLRILKSVDTQAQTVVQGPPGTGKTHTAAALISHLLAQGKRVLITAQTDRALREVREKLPNEIKPLCVSVVGKSRSDMADLKVAVERIAAKATEHDAAQADRDIAAGLEKIDSLRRKRAACYTKLLDAREAEIKTHQHGQYEGTLAAIAQQYQAGKQTHGWIVDFVDVPADSTAPLDDSEIAIWHHALVDEALVADEPDAMARLVDVEDVPTPDVFAVLCEQERTARQAADQYDELRKLEAFHAVRELAVEDRKEFQEHMHAIADEAQALEDRDETWMNEALSDVRAGRSATWENRAEQLRSLVDQARPMVDEVGPLTTVEIDDSSQVPAVRSLAITLQEHLAGGGAIKTQADGTPKVGMLAAKPVKDAAPLFEQVKVNGLAPTTVGQLSALVTYIDAESILDAMDRQWPAAITIPEEDTLHERLQWHVTELKQLDRVLELGRQLSMAEQQMEFLGIRPPAWTDLRSVLTYARIVDAASAQDAWTAASEPLDALGEKVDAAARWHDAGDCVIELAASIREGDRDGYARTYARLARLHEVRRRCAERDELRKRLDAQAPQLGTAIAAAPKDEVWPERLKGFVSAWEWAAAGAWILGQDATDVNVLQAQITHLEGRIRTQVENVAATRAWSHAVSPSRLTGQAHADLTQYAQLVRDLGGGFGKYAAQKRAGIRRAMERCRASVPVWIMPLYRIAEQFRVEENMFDVVLVDEASQAGLEASFLQYLAPKIVVIGDDKQVSPSAVGIHQQQVRDLANQYLASDRYRDSWVNPKRSLFDEAVMRYGGRITLVEHRRCVPEIIGFSNKIAYEPEGVRLIPVRQYGADRLEPIKPVHVPDGYVSGTTNKVNHAEADAIVDQIEKCLVDPAYDKKTFGVISLLGQAQAREIQNKVLDRIGPEEWAARDLRCGDASDFQGSERDVMFLSMVTSLEPDRRYMPLTRDEFVQRFNVAASRAKDQMWVFHSIPLDQLANKDDMRYQLLDYCYGVAARANRDQEGVLDSAVPDDIVVEPFDSLFEQRVFNRIFDRGYSVIPQYDAEGYRIDLVVVGGEGKLAVECDGDVWHGPDAYERDLARQRDLERCGWQFFRVRESAFYVDQAGALKGLWDKLDELKIRPSGWVSDDPEPEKYGDVEELIAVDPDGAVTITSATQPEVQLASPSAEAIERPADDAPEIGYHDVESDLSHYEAFAGKTIHPANASPASMREGLLEIVATEGPVTGSRLHTAYIKASGGQRVGKSLAYKLNSAISSAVRSGMLLVDDPLNSSRVTHRTYRLPDQPIARVRELGPRSLDQVPPRELAELISQQAEIYGWGDEDQLYRAVLAELGLQRLTSNVRAILEDALLIAE